MKIYIVELISDNTNLDLITYAKQINDCLTEILNKGKGLINFEIKKINKSFLQLSVVENDKWWHQTFGKLLANEYGMRQFCFEDDTSKMFNWK